MKVLITGANKGIGYAIAQRLMESKKVDFLTITSRSAENCIKAIESLKKTNEQVKLGYLVLDYLSEESKNDFFGCLKNEDIVYDVLVLNSGVMFNGKTVNKEIYKITMQTNYFVTIELAEEFIKHNLLKPNGKIIFTSSGLGKLNRLKNNKDLLAELEDYRENLTIKRLHEIVEIYEKELFDLKESKK
jgi:short-subunit dehydrogenase